MGSYEIVELFPFTSDVDAEAVVTLHNAVGREKIPYRQDASVDEYRAKNDEPGIDMRHFGIADDNGGLIGLLISGVWVDGTNSHLLWVQIGVREDARGRGIGRALLARAAEFARQNGKSLITADTISTVPAGKEFSEAIGADIAIREVTNTVLISSIDLSMLEEWRATAPTRAPGYEVIVFDGPYPPEFHEDIARLFVMAEEDMPYEDLDMEPMLFTAETVADREAQVEGIVERTTAVARHSESGRLVGFSGIIVGVDDHETLHTTLTVVDREHRGFALGKWIKAAVILRAIEKYPSALRLVTENAVSNAPMLGINDAIGFTPEFEMLSYQATVESVESYLNQANDSR